MTAPVFVDTGAWYALQVPNDRHHRAATAALKALLARRRSLVTSSWVIGETFTLLQVRHGSEAAWRFHDGVLRSGSLRVHRPDEQTEEGAWSLMRRFQDQPFSYVDGVSFAVMKRLGLQEAFAFDGRFAAAGFVRLPG